MQISYLSTAKSGVLMVAERDIPIATMALSVFSKKRKPGRGAGDKARVGNNGDSRGSGGGSGNRPGSGNGNDPRKMKRSSQVSESHVYGNESLIPIQVLETNTSRVLLPVIEALGIPHFLHSNLPLIVAQCLLEMLQTMGPLLLPAVQISIPIMLLVLVLKRRH